ncbi:Integrator complex subunit 3 [Homalodisca vitripennis]|nr:Integrator complex subunit 3 [Homalodisca vitripennis]
MERKVVFLTSHVRFGQHKRYQDWFQKQYLATPESQTLRIDLIRFIVGVIHPTNELLCSDIIPRWAIIGWLLTSCTSNVAAANAKLALFYDWLFFDTERDNIMNIEPAILVMHHSMRSHPVVTATLLDFLCRIIPNFYPPLSEKVRQGIYASLRHIMEKRVLSTLYTLFDHSRLDKELRVMVRETFQEFCYPHPSLEGVKLEESKEEMVNHLGEGVGVGMAVGGVTNHHSPSEPTFSDEEGEASIRPHVEEEDDDDIPLEYNNTSCHFKQNTYRHERIRAILVHLYCRPALPYLPCSFPVLPDCRAKVKLKGSPLPDEWKDDDDEVVKNLEGPFRDAIERLQAETDNEAKCEAMERIVQLVIQDDEVDSDTLTTVGQCLCAVLRHTWTTRVFPETVTEDSIEDSIGRPLFVLFRNLAELSEDDSRRLPLLTVLSEMYSRCQRIGYLLLYYLQASTLGDDEGGKIGSNGKSQVFKELCETQDRELEAGLLADLKLCQEEDVNLLCWLLPAVYTQFPQVAVGNTALLHLVVSTVDARQLQELVCRVVQGRLVMFRENSFQEVLSASLSWETFEQFCLWQLVTAHGIPIDYVMPILPRLDHDNHAEALTAILLMLKHEKPTAELVKQVLCREVGPAGDMFVVSALRCWCRDHEERLGELVAALLVSCCPQASPNKRKRGKTSGNPSAEKLLGHLDRLRSGCRQLYKLDCMQRALQQAQTSCTEAQKNHFSNLFALVELDDPGRGKGRGRKPNHNTKGKSKAYKNVSDSSEESSEVRNFCTYF